ncbi:MAG: hypothetical protein IKK26_03295 [Clostridia bacterium]|nr:hypothetical protein [Clostridia bacterium]
MANKDDIISAQLEVIRAMTEKNMKSVGADLFGAPSLSNKSEEIKEEAKKETQAEEMAEKAEKEDI